ncbi:uncharacterized protein LOC106143448 [Amyelois transitella]|uniref:uncharacterized protein LOC106143448 n=1 Tax=Amyelois transitella TaxID=680683 RepID=UPI00298F77DC|nr:uncharacterized protein LOC106143448 [Amyelois transitella]
MSTDDIVIINDDDQKDSDVEIVDITKENSTELKSSDNDAIIVVDDENTPTDNDVIEIKDMNRETNNRQIKAHLEKVCSENRLIGEFIEKCLDIENSCGMLRVIYRSFLPLYFELEDNYKDSENFKKLIDMKLRALELNPNRKFSHVKSVCEVMKNFKRNRKKVQFITLATSAKAKSPIKRKRRHPKCLTPYKKVKRKVVQENANIILIDDHDESSVISMKNTVTTLANKTIQDDDDVVILEDTPSKENNSTNSTVENGNIITNSHSSSKNCDNQIETTIKSLERQIEFYKKQIDHLEQQEVNWSDMYNSSYIQCEKYKSCLVSLYKRLCSLTGQEAIKRRKVKFMATDNRPQLPVKILENFINENIGSDGIPFLPDFMDVVMCVTKANSDGGLGWTQARIMSEARNLFTYCGQALQDNRKKRDWRYLLACARANPDDDPAEKDPELMERLEANRRIAVKKESDVLEKYVKMEQSYDSVTPFSVAQDASDDEDVGVAEINYVNNNIVAISSPRVYNHNRTFTSQKDTFNDEYFKFVASQTDNIIHQNNCIDGTNTRLLEISIDSVGNPNFSLVANPGNNVNDVNNRTMLEVQVEIDKPPEVKLINVPSINYNKENQVSVQNVVLGMSEESHRSELLDPKAGNNNMDFSLGNIVIQEVFSIATKQEIKNTKVNDSDINIKIRNNDISFENKYVEQSNKVQNLEDVVSTAETNHKNTIVSSQDNVETEEIFINDVKPEPSDVLKEMQMFGDSVTATVFDIEDPFLVIEISDSSDESDGDTEISESL